jgi:hypothetical protein
MQRRAITTLQQTRATPMTTTRAIRIDLIDHVDHTKETLTLGEFFDVNADALTEIEIDHITASVEKGVPYFAAFHMGGDYEIRRAA